MVSAYVVRIYRKRCAACPLQSVLAKQQGLITLGSLVSYNTFLPNHTCSRACARAHACTQRKCMAGIRLSEVKYWCFLQGAEPRSECMLVTCPRFQAHAPCASA